MTQPQRAEADYRVQPIGDGTHSHFLQAGATNIHYLDYGAGDPPIFLLHGLSANANEFCGLVEAGLASKFRVIAPDLRGRGRTDKPPTGYSMADHAADVVALMNHLKVGKVVMGGHSFGALLSIYMAATHPELISKLIVIDAAIQMHPQVRELIKPSLDRLGQVMPSVDDYMSRMRAAPHVVGYWDNAIESYYRSEIQENADGTAQSMTSATAIAQALDGVLNEEWADLVANVTQPVLLLNATGEYGPPGSPPVVPAEYAMATAKAFSSCKYVEIPGNHLTMVFGKSGIRVSDEIEAFVRGQS